MEMKKKTKIYHYIFLLFIFIAIFLFNNNIHQVEAAGVRNLVATEDENGVWSYNEGYRPFIDYQTKTTAGIARKQEVFVYVKQGETIYFGSSVTGTRSSLNGGKEVAVVLPNGRQENFDIVDKGAGHIYTPEKELNGPNYGGKTNGYNPLSIYVDGENYTEGIYTFTFFSYSGSENQYYSRLSETSALTLDASLAKGYVASFDVTVVEEENGLYTEKTGRLWADYIAINMGLNSSPALYSNVFVLTSDGYIYDVDFNGMDPYGFIFFATNRGLVDTSNNTSLYMSVFAKNNECSNPTYTKHGEVIPVQFHKPNAINTKYDKTFKIFFEVPGSDLPQYIKPDAYEPGAIKDIRFTGINSVDNYGRVGEGGYFHFRVENATSYEIKLDFTDLTAALKDENDEYILDEHGEKIYERVQAVDRLNRKLYTDPNGNEVSFYNYEFDRLTNQSDYTPIYIDGIVYLRNSCNDGDNNVYWNGKDGNGRYLPKGVYGGDECNLKVTVTPKSGEYHFVMLDVENNANGIKIKMIGDVLDSNDNIIDIPDDVRSTVYYNNYNPELLLKGQIVKDGAEIYCVPSEDKSLTGVNTSIQGAAAFDHGYGDSNLMDLWTFVTRQSHEAEEIAKINEFTLTADDEIITEPDPHDDPNVKGTITGRVFYDYLDNGGIMNLSEGDYPLENVNVKLYLYTYNEATSSYDSELLYQVNSDALGNYYFANLDLTTDKTYYEVKVSSPNEYAHCTTNNQTISNIKIEYDEDDLTKLDVINQDVGFFWSVKNITINKQWSLTSNIPKKIRLNVLAYDNQGRRIVDEESTYGRYDVLNVELSPNGSWSTILNLQEKDQNGQYIVYYPAGEQVLITNDAGADVWVDADLAGYDYDILPHQEDVAPISSNVTYTINNRRRCIELEKVLDQRVEKAEGETFTFLLQDNTSSQTHTITITIPKGEYKKSVVLDFVDTGHNYTVTEINIPDAYTLDTDNSKLLINEITQQSNANSSSFEINFDYDSTQAYVVEFHNKAIVSNVTVNKVVGGTKGDTTKDFDFTFKIDSDRRYTAVKTAKDGTTSEITLGNNSRFSLKDSESIEIQKLPYGANFSIEEDNYTSELGYTTTVNGNLTNKYESVVTADNQSVEFKNTLDATSQLGVDTATGNKYFTTVVVIAAVFLITYIVLFRTKSKTMKPLRAGNRKN